MKAQQLLAKKKPPTMLHRSDQSGRKNIPAPKEVFIMSYISNADAAAIRTRFTAAAAPRPRDVSRLPAGVPVGPTLEVALFVATASFVSLFLCTGLAGLIL